MRAFALLDRADMIIGNVLRSRADAAARTQVEQWQLDLATVRAQLDGRACVYCGAADQPMRPNEAWGRRAMD